ncbi:MAG: hypothetical protein ACT4PW_09705 [Acidimicrobiia bacterium]
MAAPEFVPRTPLSEARAYVSPPLRAGGWRAARPGDLDGAGQPHGDGFGSPGPDQGYALSLARQFDGALHLDAGEHRADVIAGCLGVALKRASLFGRAPTVHDWTVAFTVWGYLDDDAPSGVRELRQRLFREVGHAGQYSARRAIVDTVPDAILRLTPDAVGARYRDRWDMVVDRDEPGS